MVTGASSGIGAAIARELAHRGFQVLACGRRREALDALAHPAVHPWVADLASEAGRHSLLAEVERVAGAAGAEVLVNNAGYGEAGAVEELPLERWRLQLETNLVAPLALTQALLPAMRRRRRGVIVNISSAAAVVTLPLLGAYCTSKRALETWSEALAMELAGSGVRIVVVRPGNVDTAFDDRMRAGLAQWAAADSPYANAYARLGGGPLAGGPGPGRVARVVVRAILARRSPLYLAATADARALQWAERWLPRAWLLALVRRQMLR